MPAGSGVFSVLPESFFSPLARVNREHYAALLVLYYRLFQENTCGLERELVIREFMTYLAMHRDTLAAESDEAEEEEAGDRVIAAVEPETQELDFGSEPSVSAPEDAVSGHHIDERDERTLASRFLRRLVAAGWLG